MDNRTQIAAMCLQGLLSNQGVDMTLESYNKITVEYTDGLLDLLTRTSPSPQPELLATVKAGDVLIGWRAVSG